MNSIDRRHLYLLFFAQAAALLPVFFALPKWILVYWALACFWRIQILLRSWSFPNLYLKIVGILIGLALLRFSFSSLFSVELFVSFFIINFSLKAVELHQRSDALLLVFLNFICLAVGFLFYQNILVSVYAVVALVVCVQAWVALYRHRSVSLSSQLWFASGIVFKALPIMLVLFVMMPRLGQIWQMPSQSQTGQTGISDSMSPGQFNQLIQSNAIAFRASFPNDVQVPLADQRYWRAMVFESFDGSRWSRADSWRALSQTEYSSSGKPNAAWGMVYDESSVISYSVLLEPHQQKWLFSLTPPVQAKSESINIRFTKSSALQSRFKIASRASYTVTSAMRYQYNDSALSAYSRSLNLSLPLDGGARAQEFATSLRAKHGVGIDADSSIIDEVLAFYRASFFYTLQPPAVPDNFIDAFLFQTQRGFCEHFSSSFTYLMRAAGIPARVVVGYQGGEKNPLENYLVVRQRDAHAWSEVWLDGQGWVRIDPTAAVAPSRVQQGLAAALDSEEQSLVGTGFSGFGTLAWLQLRMDLLSFNWHKWVVSYDDQSQTHFFQKVLGGADAWRVAIFFILSFGGILAAYFILSILPSRSKRVYAESSSYARHLTRLKSLGFEKHLSESPKQFALRVAESQPHWRQDLVAIADMYETLAYVSSSKVSQKEFARLCQQWRT